MWRNYLKIAIRNLAKYKGYSLINICGLAIGLACCFLIVLYVQHELSYDEFHEHAPRIYRLLHVSVQDPSARSALSASAYAPHLVNEFPEIEHAVRFFTTINRASLKHGAEARTVGGFVFADGSVFDVFSFRLLRGHPETALSAPNSMVLTEEAAKSWFGDEDAIGKTITYLRGDTEQNLQVTGILEKVPAHSHLQFDYLVSFSSIKPFMGEDALEEYTNFNYYTYVLLPEGVSPQELAPRFADFLRKYRGDNTAESVTLALQPLTDIHLTTDIRWDVGSNNDTRYLYIFSVVALFILLIASINFVNLSTARAALRAKEVGVRKVVGAHRHQLILQLFGESIFACVIAMLLALGLLQLSAPVVGNMIGQEFNVDLFGNLTLLLMLAGIGLLSGIVAGVYPALVLSAFNPSAVLKESMTRGAKGAKLRKGLIIAQFSISVVLLVAMVTVYNQLQYMKNRNLGFDKERVLMVSLSGPVKEHFETFRSKLVEHINIQKVALGTVPGRVGTSRGYKWPGDKEEESTGFYTMFVDPYSVEALGLQIVQGRDFSEKIPTDVTNAYILNEAAVRELEWDNSVGKPFRVWDEEMGQVIGVVKDFHFKSLHHKIEPLVLDIKPEWSWTAVIRTAPGNIGSTLDIIKKQWQEFEAELPFNYRFLDADFERLYRSEERLGRLFSGFTFLAIFVACLGLFGLAAFMAEQRTKEIGIRKVLGASVRDILLLLSKEFTQLVLVAFMVAIPFAYYAMKSWLQNFAYRVTLDATPFVLCGLLVLVIALLTVSSQAFKAALSNPAKSLRYE
ncbi:FtsX-like permease family protein [candidate division KSB1 bacterium]|nr:FtsX-like permease family protein [candidate division KSB1 bacterium]NIR69802.1 FtsX-like permease family protein [candidate division KSB1 bacterium]NIS25792.1 FtsX-like permease family protein [candidate division KSB1 bacterium]NIT72666.1 FtsX-like permease family protein [candidate division KSB1 bacterium]NIU26481.1 FtsX-like permease family protein [candidate division KSB1 bacterium]